MKFKLAKSVGKMLFFSVVVFIFSNLDKIGATESFFSDSTEVSGNAVQSGWWVAPEVSVLAPEKDDVWQVGAKYKIKWTAESSDSQKSKEMEIDLDYSCGEGWKTIACGIQNDGEYEWKIPEDIGSHCRVKVSAADPYKLKSEEESEEFGISWMVTLNEFLANPPSGVSEWVELFNSGDETVNLDGWTISDSKGPADHSRKIDSAHTDGGKTQIAPGDFLVVRYSGDGFYLNNTGSDEVKLFDKNGNLADIHGYKESDLKSGGGTIARVPDGIGDWVDPVPTPGEKNTKEDDKKDFQKYYGKICFDKNGHPVCGEEFMKNLEIWPEEEKKKDDSEDGQDTGGQDLSEVKDEGGDLLAQEKKEEMEIVPAAGFKKEEAEEDAFSEEAMES